MTLTSLTGSTDRSCAQRLLEYYAARYLTRVGKKPRQKDLDRTLATTLLQMCGGFDEAIRVLDRWFDSPDPLVERDGFGLGRCFSAINRLVAAGDLTSRGNAEQQRAIRTLAVALLEPRVRIVRRHSSPTGTA